MPELAHVLGRAFIDDPMLRWPLDQHGDMGSLMERAFGLIYEGIADSRMIWEAGDAHGFAVWIPPGASDDMFESDAAVRDLLAPLTDDGGARYDTLWSWIEDRVPGDVWYLDALGVDPDHQATGVGAALIRHGLDRAEADGRPAFLETALERNVSYYERFGFAVIEEGEPAPDGPHIWFMQTSG
jgi:GNAT superfamily N-acetyltransferase